MGSDENSTDTRPRDLQLHHAPHDHEMRTHFARPDRLHDPLYVVCVVFNAVRYRTRWKHYQDFAKRVAEAGGVLVTVEAAFGGRDFAVTESGNPYHVQVRTRSELWLKECLINRGVVRLSEVHPDWSRVAWVDADVHFERDDVMDATRHELEHYDVVQMWSDALDMGPDGRPLRQKFPTYSYAWCLVNDVAIPSHPSYYYAAAVHGGIWWHPGYAWACTREWWDRVGGLIDWTIVGNGDYYMAESMAGRLVPTWLGEKSNEVPSDNYGNMILAWQARCQRWTLRGLGFVPGLVLHQWHGRKTERGYETRWRLLVDNKFDPLEHIKRDSYGVYVLDEHAPRRLRDGLRAVARGRNEDGTEA